MITLQFSTERDAVSGFIRWATRAPFSHCDCVLPNGCLLGARFSGGVRVRKPFYANFSRIARYTCNSMNPKQEEVFYDFLYAQVWKPYDTAGIFNFLLHRKHDWRAGKAWFCDALLDAASIQAQDAFLMGDPCDFTPATLTYSPKLEMQFDETPPFTFTAIRAMETFQK